MAGLADVAAQQVLMLLAVLWAEDSVLFLTTPPGKGHFRDEMTVLDGIRERDKPLVAVSLVNDAAPVVNLADRQRLDRLVRVAVDLDRDKNRIFLVCQCSFTSFASFERGDEAMVSIRDELING